MTRSQSVSRYQVVDCFLLTLIFSQVLCTEYYVVPTNSTENHCHKLQYYAEKQAKYFVTDSKFVFLPGDHTLETNIKVKSVSRLVMRSAEPNQRLCGHHVREKQPVVINCTGLCKILYMCCNHLHPMGGMGQQWEVEVLLQVAHCETMYQQFPQICRLGEDSRTESSKLSGIYTVLEEPGPDVVF